MVAVFARMRPTAKPIAEPPSPLGPLVFDEPCFPDRNLVREASPVDQELWRAYLERKGVHPELIAWLYEGAGPLARSTSNRVYSHEINASIVKNLRRELNKRGWTISDLSARMNEKYTPRYLGQTLTDTNSISLTDTADVAKTLGVELGDLLA
ncbi:MAG: helix-turn-helix transcriptional regulator [Pirellulaceae bacterium]